MLSGQPAGRTTNTSTALHTHRRGEHACYDESDVITRTTLKALWVGGGGAIATWLAVAPAETPPAAAPSPTVRAVESSNEDDLNAQAERLRARSSTATLEPSKRNPFRFNAARPSERAGERSGLPIALPPAQAMPAVPLPPPLRLAGVTESKVADGIQRMAVLTGSGQIYLAKVGERVGGQFTVVAVEPEAAVLRDETGAESRLLLR